MKCARVVDRVDAYLCNELSRRRRSSLERHLHECDRCREFFSWIREETSAAREAADEVEAVSAGFSERVLDRMDAEQPCLGGGGSGRWPLRPRTRWMVGSLAAAGVAFLILLGLWTRDRVGYGALSIAGGECLTRIDGVVRPVVEGERIQLPCELLATGEARVFLPEAGATMDLGALTSLHAASTVVLSHGTAIVETAGEAIAIGPAEAGLRLQPHSKVSCRAIASSHDFEWRGMTLELLAGEMSGLEAGETLSAPAEILVSGARRLVLPEVDGELSHLFGIGGPSEGELARNPSEEVIDLHRAAWSGADDLQPRLRRALARADRETQHAALDVLAKAADADAQEALALFDPRGDLSLHYRARALWNRDGGSAELPWEAPAVPTLDEGGSTLDEGRGLEDRAIARCVRMGRALGDEGGIDDGSILAGSDAGFWLEWLLTGRMTRREKIEEIRRVLAADAPASLDAAACRASAQLGDFAFAGAAMEKLSQLVSGQTRYEAQRMYFEALDTYFGSQPTDARIGEYLALASRTASDREIPAPTRRAAYDTIRVHDKDGVDPESLALRIVREESDDILVAMAVETLARHRSEVADRTVEQAMTRATVDLDDRLRSALVDFACALLTTGGRSEPGREFLISELSRGRQTSLMPRAFRALAITIDDADTREVLLSQLGLTDDAVASALVSSIVNAPCREPAVLSARLEEILDSEAGASDLARARALVCLLRIDSRDDATRARVLSWLERGAKSDSPEIRAAVMREIPALARLAARDFGTTLKIDNLGTIVLSGARDPSLAVAIPALGAWSRLGQPVQPVSPEVVRCLEIGADEDVLSLLRLLVAADSATPEIGRAAAKKIGSEDLEVSRLSMRVLVTAEGELPVSVREAVRETATWWPNQAMALYDAARAGRSLSYGQRTDLLGEGAPRAAVAALTADWLRSEESVTAVAMLDTLLAAYWIDDAALDTQSPNYQALSFGLLKLRADLLARIASDLADAEPARRLGAVDKLAALGEDTAVRMLIALTDDPDPALRERACALLSRYSGRELACTREAWEAWYE